MRSVNATVGNWRCWLLAAWLCAALTPLGVLHAGEAAAESKLTPVTVGMYVNQISDLSLKDSRFTVDFFIWFRWAGDKLKPHETFDLCNGKIDSKQVVQATTGSQPDGKNYACLRVFGTINRYWDVRRFPLDNHTLTIDVEDNASEDHILQYVADRDNSALDTAVQIPGWAIGKQKADARAHTYKSNYGDLSLPTGNESSYSRFTYSVELELHRPVPHLRGGQCLDRPGPCLNLISQLERSLACEVLTG